MGHKGTWWPNHGCTPVPGTARSETIKLNWLSFESKYSAAILMFLPVDLSPIAALPNRTASIVIAAANEAAVSPHALRIFPRLVFAFSLCFIACLVAGPPGLCKNIRPPFEHAGCSVCAVCSILAVLCTPRMPAAPSHDALFPCTCRSISLELASRLISPCRRPS